MYEQEKTEIHGDGTTNTEVWKPVCSIPIGEEEIVRSSAEVKDVIQRKLREYGAIGGASFLQMTVQSLPCCA